MFKNRYCPYCEVYEIDGTINHTELCDAYFDEIDISHELEKENKVLEKRLEITQEQLELFTGHYAELHIEMMKLRNELNLKK